MANKRAFAYCHITIQRLFLPCQEFKLKQEIMSNQNYSKMKQTRILLAFTMFIMVMIGCSKPDDEYMTGSVNDQSAADLFKNPGDIKAALISATKVPDIDEFCEYKIYDFIAGQTKDVGDIMVANTNDSLFITMNVPGGFAGSQENLKIWIGTTIFSDRPSAGQFPYKYTIDNGVTTVNIGFSLSELKLTCDAAFYIVIHGDVPGDTAFGGDIEGPGSAWWFYIHYTAKCCEPPVECKISAKSVVTDVKCFGASTGAIDLIVMDGTAPITYLWNNGATTEDLIDVPAGTYSVTVTDANKCVVTVKDIIVNQPADGISADFSVKEISKAGADDGAIDVTVSGGTPPYAFLWNTGATSEDLSDLGPGTYTLTITDNMGCTATVTAILSEGPKPKGFVAFARKTYDPMVHCFMNLDMDKNGVHDFNSWGWTNGAMPEHETFISKYELFIGAEGCDDLSKATKVGDVTLHHYNGSAIVKIILLPGYTMDKTSLYIGNDMLPMDGGVYTIDPAKYPYQHSLSGATTDTYSVSVSGSVYIIVYANILPENIDN